MPEGKDTPPPSAKPAVFEIRTLADIYKLPTLAQMETCLEEVSRGMIQSRCAEDAMLAVLEAMGHEPPERALEWPEVVKWSDDHKGCVEALIGGEFSIVTTKENKDGQ
jgi:hypothetical protein